MKDQDAYNFLPDESFRVADVVATSKSRILELSVKDFVSIVVPCCIRHASRLHLQRNNTCHIRC